MTSASASGSTSTAASGRTAQSAFEGATARDAASADAPWGGTRWGRPRWGPVSRRRRWRRSRAARAVAVVLVGLAAWLAFGALRPPPVDPGVPTVVASRDLPLGSVLTADDLRLEARPAAERPDSALVDVQPAVGQMLAGPVLAGEVVTPARFRGPPQLAGLAPGLLAVSVPVADPALLATIRPADTVTLLGAGSGQPIASSALVLARDVPSGAGLAVGGATTGHLVVAVTGDEARGIAVALGPSAAAGGLVVAVRG